MSYNKKAYEYSTRDDTNFRDNGSSSGISTATVTITNGGENNANCTEVVFECGIVSEIQNYSMIVPDGLFIAVGETKVIDNVALYNGKYTFALPPGYVVTTEGDNYSVDDGALFITGDCELTMTAFNDGGDEILEH